MKRSIDNIISECINNLFEAKIEVKNDPVVSDAQKRIYGHMSDLAKRGDKKLLSLMKSKGYDSDVKQDVALKNADKAFKDGNLTDEVNQDIVEVAKILQDYTINGGIRFNELKRDYPKKYDYIIRMKNFMDLKGLTYMYDKTANKPSTSYGDWAKTGDLNDFDFNSITDQDAKKYRGDKIMGLEVTKTKMKLNLLDQYLSFKYGVKLNIPNITLTNGNSKLPDNTLIINFTSALNCPAWNECLVKHACYARVGEKRNPTQFRGNENRSLYWLTTEHDEKLLTLMMDFARSYCFDYNKVADYLIKNKMVKSNNSLTLAKKMAKLSLDDKFFTPEIIDVMIKFRRIDFIRLNENGDFVGQWLVDAWDEEAGKYQPYGVNVSAYTCRHLNYEGIKNIILNTSFQNGKGNVARRFIAIPENIYNALDETYGGKNNNLEYKSDNIMPNPQPLFNVDNNGNLVPNGKIYYKCPCGRKYKKDTKVSCYQCNLCYKPKTENADLYVFVSAHGSAAKSLKGYDLIKNNIGVSQNFFKKMPINNLMGESYENSQSIINMASKEGIQGVTNNAVKSTYEHFSNLGKNNMNESEIIKISENELINIIKETIIKNNK